MEQTEIRLTGSSARSDVDRAIQMIRPLGYQQIVYTYENRRGLASVARSMTGKNGVTVIARDNTIAITVLNH